MPIARSRPRIQLIHTLSIDNLFQLQRKLNASGNFSCVCDISVPCQLETFSWHSNSLERKTNLFTIFVDALVIRFVYFYSFNYAACFKEKLSEHARLNHLLIRICRNLSFKSMSQCFKCSLFNNRNGICCWPWCFYFFFKHNKLHKKCIS